jgi:hypothetical protein
MSPLGTPANTLPCIPAPDDDENYDNDDGYEAADGVGIGREIEVFTENLLQFLFVHHKSHITRPGIEPCHRCGKPATTANAMAWHLSSRSFGAHIEGERRWFSSTKL